MTDMRSSGGFDKQALGFWTEEQPERPQEQRIEGKIIDEASADFWF